MNWSNLLKDERLRLVTKRLGSSDLRTEFEKDYHRIIGSASFRRLQDKTQVFPLDKSDFIRTRLTHSLEVSSFAKSLGQNICQKIQKEIKDSTFLPEYQIDICDILQCAGLIHDIGNPPFGHFGETVIRQWFVDHLGEYTFQNKKISELLIPQMKNDFYHFEGNTQALRLVSKLHYLVDEHGMNLTIALMGSIIKYPVSSLEISKSSGDIKTKKMGYYYAEKEIFEKIQTSLDTHGNRHPLAFVLEAADDIAYKTADIEDAYKKGFINYEQLVDELKRRGGDEREYLDYYKMIAILEEKYQKAKERNNTNPAMYAIQNWIITVQGALISQATESFIKNYDEIMAGNFSKELLFSGYGYQLAKVLGDIAHEYVFTSETIYKLEIAAQVILDSLMNKFIPAAILYDTGEKMTEVEKKLVSLISDNYKTIYKVYSQGKTEVEKLYLRILLATDFICGMTDSYAKRLYQELNGIF